MSLMRSSRSRGGGDSKEANALAQGRDRCRTAGASMGYRSLIAAVEPRREWLSIIQNTISRVLVWEANGCFHREGNLGGRREEDGAHRAGWDYVRLLSFTSVIQWWRSRTVMYTDEGGMKQQSFRRHALGQSACRQPHILFSWAAPVALQMIYINKNTNKKLIKYAVHHTKKINSVLINWLTYLLGGYFFYMIYDKTEQS